MRLGIIFYTLMAAGAAAESLDDHRWKSRLLVVSGMSQSLREELAHAAAGLRERDVRVYDLTAIGNRVEWITQLGKKLSIRADRPEVVLLGKDGHTTRRWKPENFSTKALFSAIDAMPMRKSEMRRD